MTTPSLAGFKRFARGRGEPAPTCDLCGATRSDGEHRHVADVVERRLACVCPACTLLFEAPGAGAGRHRLVPRAARPLGDRAVDLAALGIPVTVAALMVADDGTPTALFPGPAGVTEAAIDPAAWEAATEPGARPAPEIEAVLVARDRAPWVVPIDQFYELAGRLRTEPEAMAAGPVPPAVSAFFETLPARSAP